LEHERLNLDPIKSRLIHAGYPHPEPGQPSTRIREFSREAEKARAELRAHIIDDIWALLEEVESLRSGRKE
jgi:hypothetical protein